MSDHSFVGEVGSSMGDSGEQITLVHVPQVCVIESPSPVDILDRRREGLALSESLTLAAIRNAYYAVSNQETLLGALERIERFAGMKPVRPEGQEAGKFVSFPRQFLHFSCHGNEDGIGLTNGDFVPWEALGRMLLHLGTRLGVYHPEVIPVCMLCVCMSSCGGLHARKMATDPSVCPFIAVVGSDEPVAWTDSLTGFITFYHHLIHKGRTLQRAVRSMNEAAMVRCAFRAITPADVGTTGMTTSVRVVLMHVNARGKFCWAWNTQTGSPERPEVRLKDTFICEETNQPFPYLDDLDRAEETMRQNPGQYYQVEHGVGIDLNILSH